MKTPTPSANIQHKFPLLPGLALLLLLALGQDGARAQNYTNFLTGDWTSANIWSNGVIAASSNNTVIVFTPAGSINTTNNNAGGFLLNELALVPNEPVNLNSPSGSYLLFTNDNAGDLPEITNYGTSTLTLNSAITLANNLTVGAASSGAITINSNITELVVGTTAAAIVMTGTNTLTLTGQNTFSGGVDILSGTVSSGTAANSNPLPFGTGTITLGNSSGANNATLQCALSGTFTNNIIVAAGSSGTLTIQDPNNNLTNYGSIALNNNLTVNSGNSGKVVAFVGTVTESSAGSPALTVTCPEGGADFAGGLVLGSGGLTLAQNAALATSAFTVGPGAISSATTGNLTFNANSLGIFTISATNINNAGNLTNSGVGSGTITISGNIGGNVVNVVENSTNSQLTLSGSNSFSGGLYILNGTVAGASTNPFVFGTGTITLGASSGANNAALKNNATAGTYTTNSNPIIVAAGSSGTLSLLGNNNYTIESGNLTLDNNLSVSSGNVGKNYTLSGLVTETSAGSPALTISTPAGSSSSVGPPTLSGGVVVGSGGLTFANYSPAGTFTVGPGAITSTTTGSLTFDANSNSVFVVSAASINPSGSLTNAGTGAGTTTISGNLGSNVTSVVENSATSALVLSGTNVNSVTLVALGTLGLAGGSLSNSPVTVGPGGTNNVAASTAIAGLNDVGGLGGVVLNNVNNTNNTLTLVGSGAYSFNGSVENGTNGAATMLSLTLSGSGVQALGGANSYSGPTTVTAGTLLVNGNSSGVTNAFMVGAGGSLGGVGTIGGAVTFAAGSAAVLTNGAVLTLTNSLTIAASGTLPVVALNLSNNVAVGDYTLATYNPAGSSGAFNSAPVLLSGSFAANTTASITTGGGAVVLSVTSASTDNNASLASLVLAPGGALTPAFATNVYSYSATNAYTSNPVTVTASSADPQATMTLSLNGTLVGPLTNGVASGALVLSLNPPTNTVVVTVISPDLSVTNPYTVNVLLQPSQTVPALVSARNGTSLVLSWPADHLGYRLLVQTNNLQGGISRNPGDWGTVPGSTTVTTTNVSVIQTNLDEYYRLVYP